MCTLPAPVARSNARKPAVRTLRILKPITNVSGGIVRLSVSDKATTYAVEKFHVAEEMGRVGLEWRKVGIAADPADEPYHCCLAGDGSARCDCRGHARHGHCKHAAAAAKLAQLCLI